MAGQRGRGCPADLAEGGLGLDHCAAVGTDLVGARGTRQRGGPSEGRLGFGQQRDMQRVTHAEQSGRAQHQRCQGGQHDATGAIGGQQDGGQAVKHQQRQTVGQSRDGIDADPAQRRQRHRGGGSEDDRLQKPSVRAMNAT